MHQWTIPGKNRRQQSDLLNWNQWPTLRNIMLQFTRHTKQLQYVQTYEVMQHFRHLNKDLILCHTKGLIYLNMSWRHSSIEELNFNIDIKRQIYNLTKTKQSYSIDANGEKEICLKADKCKTGHYKQRQFNIPVVPAQ